MKELTKAILACQKCDDEIIVAPLGGSGKIDADIMVVGQNTCQPKCLESGIPFTGGSGRLLDDGLAACKLTRKDVFITNRVKCATKGNQLPSQEMETNCLFFLKLELAFVKPRLVITLGKFAARNFPEGNYRVGVQASTLKNEVMNGMNVANLVHPAYRLRRGEHELFVKEFRGAVKGTKR